MAIVETQNVHELVLAKGHQVVYHPTTKMFTEYNDICDFDMRMQLGQVRDNDILTNRYYDMTKLFFSHKYYDVMNNFVGGVADKFTITILKYGIKIKFEDMDTVEWRVMLIDIQNTINKM